MLPIQNLSVRKINRKIRINCYGPAVTIMQNQGFFVHKFNSCRKKAFGKHQLPLRAYEETERGFVDEILTHVGILRLPKPRLDTLRSIAAFFANPPFVRHALIEMKLIGLGQQSIYRCKIRGPICRQKFFLQKDIRIQTFFRFGHKTRKFHIVDNV